MTSAFGNLITLLIVALFSTIGFEQVNKKVQSQKSKAFKLLSEWPFSSTFGFKFLIKDRRNLDSLSPQCNEK